MKTIILKSLELLNFKGQKQLKIDFKPDITNIYGDNATGKTTILDGFIYLLFGKDSTDRKDFEIKTLDSNNKVIKKIDHEVTCNLLIEDTSVILKRSLREKWQKKRGTEVAEFTGNETFFEIDNVPKKAGEYKSHIDSIVDEQLFKMLTNVDYFNDKLNWQDRRKILTEISGEFNDNDLIYSKKEYAELFQSLGNKSIEDFKKEISNKKRKLKNELELIPSRVDEVTRQIPIEPDYSQVNSEIEKINKEISLIESQIEDKSEITEQQLKTRQEKQTKIYVLRKHLSDIKFNEEQKLQSKINDYMLLISNTSNEIKKISDIKFSHESDLMNINKRIDNIKPEIEKLRTEWHKKNDSNIEFSDDEFKCPIYECECPLEEKIEERKEEIIQKYNKNKLVELNSINENGKKLADESVLLEEKIKKYKSLINESETELETLHEKLNKQKSEFDLIDKNVNLDNHKEYQEIYDQIKEFENIPNDINILDTSNLKSKKSELNIKLDGLKSQLTIKDNIIKLRSRIKELENQEKLLAQEISNLEKSEFIIEDFTMDKISIVEKHVNSMFKYVKFKMFNKLINGGIEETCETLIDGVPYKDANNAGKINAGIDIINILSDYFKIRCPLWIDNAESINELIPTESQLIRLIVSNDKQLKIE